MPISGNLPQGWRCWVAENVQLGVSEDQIVNTAVCAGADRAQVEEELQRARRNPDLDAAARVAQRLRKLESILRIRVEVRRQNGQSIEIPCRTRLAAEEFRSQYYAENRPVKLLDMIDDWPATRTWSPECFREHFGRCTVEITSSRNSDPQYEINLERHRRSILFADFIDQAVAGKSGNDAYLVANNRFFEKPGMAALLDDLGTLPGYLKSTCRAPHTYLWFGPAGTVTQLHYDTLNILFCQIYGSKRIALIPPDETPWLYNEVGVYSSVRFENPDLARFPLFQYAGVVEVDVHPGEILFIPVGWWHHVRSLETSISVSFTNFEFPNQYLWPETDQ